MFLSLSDPIVLLTRCILRSSSVDSLHSNNNLKNSANNYSKTRKIKCGLCNKFYLTDTALRRHIREVHDKEKQACNICDFKTVHKSCLQRHKLTHSEKVECPICKKHVASIDRHMRAHKPKDSCQICNRSITKRHMKRQLRIHTRVQHGYPK